MEYITFDQLLNEVKDEFEMYSKNSLIEASLLIPVVQSVSKLLGSRVQKRKQCLIDIDNYVAKIPLDCYKINSLWAIGKGEIVVGTPQGEHKDYKEVDLLTEPLNSDVYVTEDGFVYKTVYTHNIPSKLKYQVKFPLTIDFTLKPDLTSVEKKGQFLKTNMEYGNILIDYVAVLEDEEGNLLVPSHPIILEYYKAALKKKILETLFFNGEESAANKLQYINTQYRQAKQYAEQFVNMGEFSEYQQVYDLNRQSFYKRYYKGFL